MAISANDLFQSDLLRVRHVACRGARPGTGPVEHADSDRIVFPLRGIFTKNLAVHSQVMAEPTQAVFFAAGRPYRVSHSTAAGDDCLSLEFSADVLFEGLVAAAAVESIGDPALYPAATMPPPAIAARGLLWRRLSRALAEPLEVEETSLALLSTVLRVARRGHRPEGGRPATRARRRAQSVAVKEMLAAAPGERWSLGGIARRVYTTPYHLSRVFRDEAGIPVHRYLLHLRLAATVDSLLETDESLTSIALRLGFASSSHFSAAFRSMVGTTPSRFREAASATAARAARLRLLP